MGNGVKYCAWAPQTVLAEVLVASGNAGEERSIKLKRDQEGYHHGSDPAGRPGDRYFFRLDGGRLLPDPASRYQPDGVHGASVVMSSGRFEWHDTHWKRPMFRDLIIYELHVGTFSPEGTFAGAIGKLGHLATLGVNAIELMPIAEFAGSRNWGYDGVMIYAPTRAYGTPDDLRALVDAAHAAGIAVILDVVYNHFGPDGNYIGEFSPSHYSASHKTPWGACFNFDGEFARPVREFFLQNPPYWMEEFHIDGFRLDAAHNIFDLTLPHLLEEITENVHRRGGYVVAEDDRNESRMIRAREEGGMGFDGVWADDFHHSVRVSQTGEKAAYFAAFCGDPAEIVDTLQHGWHYRGQKSPVSGRLRGTPCASLPPERFIHCISNHDQVGNRPLGERISSSISSEGYRALSMLLCLTPYTPMLFMGQEWAASAPFLYFTDHNEELGAAITEGRRREFAGFQQLSGTALEIEIPDPQSPETFARSKLNWDEPEEGSAAGMLRLYQASLSVRRGVQAFRPASREGWKAALTASLVLAIRFEGESHSYLLLFNPGGARLGSLKDEAIAISQMNQHWELLLSSNDAAYGGHGSAEFLAESQGFEFGGPGTILLRLNLEPSGDAGM